VRHLDHACALAGYAFRICPADGGDLSEECFQAGHLDFAGSMQKLIDVNGKVVGSIPARRTSKGTFPAGSTWAGDILFLTNADGSTMCSWLVEGADCFIVDVWYLGRCGDLGRLW
jgi:hypothetical protein